MANCLRVYHKECAMDPVYFNSLDAKSKTALTCTYGEIIAGFEVKDHYVCLYMLDNFFVEIHVNKHNHELVKISPQDDIDILVAYLRELDISDAWE